MFGTFLPTPSTKSLITENDRKNIEKFQVPCLFETQGYFYFYKGIEAKMNKCDVIFQEFKTQLLH